MTYPLRYVAGLAGLAMLLSIPIWADDPSRRLSALAPVVLNAREADENAKRVDGIDASRRPRPRRF